MATTRGHCRATPRASSMSTRDCRRAEHPRWVAVALCAIATWATPVAAQGPGDPVSPGDPIGAAAPGADGEDPTGLEGLGPVFGPWAATDDATEPPSDPRPAPSAAPDDPIPPSLVRDPQPEPADPEPEDPALDADAIAEPVALSADARFVAARSAIAAGQADLARLSLVGLVGDPETPPRVLRDAWHLLARLALAEGDGPRAADAFERAIAVSTAGAAPSAILDVARHGRGVALALADRLPEAIAELARVDGEPHSPYREEALRQRARLHELAGEPRTARRLYDLFVRTYPDSPSANEARVRRAALDVAAGRTTAAIDTLRALTRVAPDSRAGLEASLLLEGLGDAPEAVREPIAAAEYLMSERRFDEAVALLTGTLEAAAAEDKPTSAERAALRRAGELLARAEYERFRFDEALALHEVLVADGAPGLSDYHLARAYAYLDRHDEADAVLLERLGGKKTRAYWDRVADLNYEHGRYREAYRAWYQARKAGRRGDPDPTERMVWCLLRMGEPAKAAAWYEDRGGARRGKTRAETRYWYGRALALAERVDDARAVFAGLVEDLPWDYYGIQAYSRLAELDGEVPEVASGAASHATVRWSDADLEGAFDQAPVRADADSVIAAIEAFADAWGEVAPEATRAAELARLGLLDEAIAELRVIDMDLRTLSRGGSVSGRARADMLDNRRDKRARGGASLREAGRRDAREAAAFSRAASELRAALRDVQRIVAEPYGLRRLAYEQGGFSEYTPSDAWRDAYPIAWPHLVATFTGQFDVPPYYLYAVMTVESAFHPHAISVSDAYGLLQMIPRTGRRVAAELGFTEFSPEVLLRPEVNVYFGTYYLSQALRKFHGQEPLAAAAYNAGPHRVAAWLRARGEGPMDMFIEEIPFDQARGYTKSVIRHLARYRAIYHGTERTYVSNALYAEHLPQPNY